MLRWCLALFPIILRRYEHKVNMMPRYPDYCRLPLMERLSELDGAWYECTKGHSSLLRLGRCEVGSATCYGRGVSERRRAGRVGTWIRKAVCPGISRLALDTVPCGGEERMLWRGCGHAKVCMVDGEWCASSQGMIFPPSRTRWLHTSPQHGRRRRQPKSNAMPGYLFRVCLLGARRGGRPKKTQRKREEEKRMVVDDERNDKDLPFVPLRPGRSPKWPYPAHPSRTAVFHVHLPNTDPNMGGSPALSLLCFDFPAVIAVPAPAELDRLRLTSLNMAAHVVSPYLQQQKYTLLRPQAPVDEWTLD